MNRITLEIDGEHLMKIDLDEPEEFIGGLTVAIECIVEQAVAVGVEPTVIIDGLVALRTYANDVFDKGRV